MKLLLLLLKFKVTVSFSFSAVLQYPVAMSVERGLQILYVCFLSVLSVNRLTVNTQTDTPFLLLFLLPLPLLLCLPRLMMGCS